MKDLKKYLLLLKLLFILRQLDNNLFFDFEDIEGLFKIIDNYNLFDYRDLKKLEVTAVTSSDYETIFNLIFERVESNLIKVATSLKGVDSLKVKNLYLLLLEVNQYKEVEELEELQRLTIKVYDSLDNTNQRILYQRLEEFDLLEEVNQLNKDYFMKVLRIFEELQTAIMEELKRCNIQLRSLLLEV